MNKNRYRWVGMILCIALLLTGCQKSTNSEQATKGDTTTKKDTTTAKAELVTYKESDEYTDWTKEDYQEITLKDSDVTIKKAGVYVLSGTLKDGQVIVDAGKTDKIRLILNHAEINCSDGASIWLKKADKVTITLADGTENVVTDGTGYTIEDEEKGAAIYSKADLTFNGTGSLIVHGKNNDGIVSKDSLKFMDGAYQIEAVDDGMVGRDVLACKAGTYQITAGGAGMKTTNEETGQGNLVLQDGTYQIEAKGKGIKAMNQLVVTGGTIQVDAQDDALHSDGTMMIEAGTLTLSTLDDGAHANDTLTVSGGTIQVTQSKEGLESNSIVITGGTIDITASDDGVNTAGGKDSSGVEGGFGKDMFADDGSTLTISGGVIHVNSNGDGLDCNGTFTMTGGEAYVSGPTNGGNGALDYNGTFTYKAGTLVAAGATGMEQAPSETGNGNSIQMTLNNPVEGNTKISVTNSEGKEILCYTPKKEFQSVILSSEQFTIGQEYTVQVGEDIHVSFSMEEELTYLDNEGTTSAPAGGMGGFGGRHGGGGRGDFGGQKDGWDKNREDGTKPEMGETPPDGF